MAEKKNIAVVWGGYTSEIVISEKSMKGIYSFLDKSLYNVFDVKITHGSWMTNFVGINYEVNKNDFSFEVDNQKIKFDFAYITIHGSPGEDGRLQGYLDMMGIPYSSCGVLTSSLTMDKYVCNRYLSSFGIKAAKSHRIRLDDSYDVARIADELGFPMFVKPNLGGSSFATTKVKSIDMLQSAIDLAFKETNEVIIESFISGTEVTCGCFKAEAGKTALPLTEVVTSNDFFDYDAKYNGQVDEITPARISDDLTNFIQCETLKIYELIGAKGFIRADFIIHEGIPYLLEVNTTPGMTQTSFVPQQIRAAGLDITRVFSEIIEYEYSKSKRNHKS